MATVGGNLMQRTRCYYFYDEAAHCNKRQPGSGCDAIEGFNRMHAILGASEQLHRHAPVGHVRRAGRARRDGSCRGPRGERAIPFEDFHRLPGDTPHIETDLRPGELITSVEIPPSDFASNSLYRKVRDRASYAFALVSVAAALEVEDGHDQRCAPRARRRGAQTVAGLRGGEGSAGAAGNEPRLSDARRKPNSPGAKGYAHNNFKIELAKRTIVSVLGELAERGGCAMSIMQKVMETVAQFMPDAEPDPLIQHKHGYVGKPFSRVDGQLKVKGEARFTAEFKARKSGACRARLQHDRQGKSRQNRHAEAGKSAGVHRSHHARKRAEDEGTAADGHEQPEQGFCGERSADSAGR